LIVEEAPPEPPALELTGRRDSFIVSHSRTEFVSAEDGVLANDSGSGLVASRETDTANGTVILNPDGSFSFTPDTGFVGSDSFIYRVTDQFGQLRLELRFSTVVR